LSIKNHVVAFIAVPFMGRILKCKSGFSQNIKFTISAKANALAAYPSAKADGNETRLYLKYDTCGQANRHFANSRSHLRFPQ
jgi:hypothetical protein